MSDPALTPCYVQELILSTPHASLVSRALASHQVSALACNLMRPGSEPGHTLVNPRHQVSAPALATTQATPWCEPYQRHSSPSGLSHVLAYIEACPWPVINSEQFWPTGPCCSLAHTQAIPLRGHNWGQYSHQAPSISWPQTSAFPESGHTRAHPRHQAPPRVL